MTPRQSGRHLARAGVACSLWLMLGGANLFSQQLPSSFGRAPIMAVCPAIEEDRSVVLMVSGTFRSVVRGDKQELQLHVDELLFGSDPGPVLSFPDWHPALFRPEVTKNPVFKEGIYSLSCERHGDRLVYDLSSRRFSQRYLPLAELSAARALATARLDRLVLGSRAIIIGRPKVTPALEAESITNAGPLRLKKLVQAAKSMPYARAYSELDFDDPPPAVESLGQTIVVEKVLLGGLEAGQEIEFRLAQAATPVPLSGNGPFLYFITDNGLGIHLAETVWDASAAPRVLASLAARNEHPIGVSNQNGSRGDELPHVQFRGSQEAAIALLGSSSFRVRWLASDRLENDGARAKQAIVRSIEEHLLSAEWGVADPYFQQWRLIRLLGNLERSEPALGKQDHVPGELERLADVLIAQATAGGTFPLAPSQPPLPASEVGPVPSRTNGYADFDTSLNHSLAWLLAEMPPDHVAARYLNRLQNLRDLTSYGWGQEAQAIIDRLQLVDRLALPAARLKSANVRWLSQMALLTSGELRFASDNQTLGLRAGREKWIWDSSTGKLLAHETAGQVVKYTAPAAELPPNTIVAEDGLQWTFLDNSPGRGEWGYRHSTVSAINIHRTAAGEPVKTQSRFLKNARSGTFEKIIAPSFFGRVDIVHPDPDPPLFGLVPGGQRLYIRTQILDRANLQSISNANVLGQLQLIRFSPSGEHYAIVTHHPRATDSPRSFRPTSESQSHKYSFAQPEFPAKLREFDALLRVHDTSSGDTLLAIKVPETLLGPKVPEEITNIAIAPDGSRVAAMTRRCEIFVWPVQVRKSARLR
jgi:hypothetical protein